MSRRTSLAIAAVLISLTGTGFAFVAASSAPAGTSYQAYYGNNPGNQGHP